MVDKKHGLRVPPQNIPSEKALLGAIMRRPDVMHDITDIVTIESFYVEKHRTIFEAMMELFSKGDPIDLLSLSTKLKDKDHIERAGGMSYLTELVDSVPSSANAKHYAELIQKTYMLRMLIEAAGYIGELGFKEEQDIEEVLDKAEKKIFDVTSSSSTEKFVALKDTLVEAWERLEKLSNQDQELRGVHTGFKSLDNKLAGLQKSDLIILAARPSIGKTTLALDVARQSAIMHGTKVGFFSLEMSSQQLVDRMLASESQVDAWRMRTGRLKNDDDFIRLQDAMSKLSDAPIYLDDQPGNNILKMRSVARRLKSEKGLDLIIVDYLQLMAPSKMKATDSMVQQMTEVSRSLKQLARELDVPVLALSQLSRAVESRGGKPRLSDLRDSGSIEQDADVVMFLHRDDRNMENGERNDIIEVLIEKHRNGPTGMVTMKFDAASTRFYDLDTNHADVTGFDAIGNEEQTF